MKTNKVMHTQFYAAVAFAAALTVTATCALADANAGAALVQSHGCMGCHGAKLASVGGDRARVMDAILHPKPPMPNYGFSAAQAGDIADYLASLTPGPPNQPRITITPAHISDSATVNVYFPGTPPSSVVAQASMSMGGSAMGSPQVELKPVGDGHTYTGRITFSMGGAWTLHIRYGGKQIDRPLQVGQ